MATLPVGACLLGISMAGQVVTCSFSPTQGPGVSLGAPKFELRIRNCGTGAGESWIRIIDSDYWLAGWVQRHVTAPSESESQSESGVVGSNHLVSLDLHLQPFVSLFGS
ncbi:hypothetical protein BZA05DRAFT_420210 [Tricharina praecox]|uniref:uncharacterized protein n=1 Tax=Tricharina praecox TaxID=43433 RepID=UPI00221E9BD3|nr:uncharacterized protein BZA05DRAFT_420210 [Tricharina praecox]KAI5848321.1 hypothetical protein BZA05DRAFT_420210 [Tricharina praecox]